MITKSDYVLSLLGGGGVGGEEDNNDVEIEKRGRGKEARCINYYA